MMEIEAGRAFDGPYGEFVHLDLRHLGEELIDRKLPFVRELTRNYVGIVPVHEPIPVRPVAHYMMGGIHTNVDAETPLPGLYSAGESACPTINGANRLGSNSLPECLVFGARAGRAAARYALEAAAVRANQVEALANDEERRIRERFLNQQDGTERIGHIREGMQRAMERGLGVYRTRQGIEEAVADLRSLRERFAHVSLDDRSAVFNTELVNALELECMLDLAQAIAGAALVREESRGAHSRRDFPERDDERFLHHSLAYYTPEGPRLSTHPVTITRWQPEERKY
jgi:fumarate reductase flavoprotein subunit